MAEIVIWQSETFWQNGNAVHSVAQDLVASLQIGRMILEDAHLDVSRDLAQIIDDLAVLQIATIFAVHR